MTEWVTSSGLWTTRRRSLLGMATLRDMPAADTAAPDTPARPSAPRARRLRGGGRDLRLALGVGLVLLAVLVGSRVRRLVTVPVDALHAPPGLARGERVDVYVTPKDGASVGGDAVTVLPALVLAGALVADPGVVDQSGSSNQVGVVLDVAAKDADRAVAAARAGDVDLVRVGG